MERRKKYYRYFYVGLAHTKWEILSLNLDVWAKQASEKEDHDKKGFFSELKLTVFILTKTVK